MILNTSSASEETNDQYPYPVAEDRATPSSLVSHLKTEISSLGPISFDRWMELCLYHPQWGYYNQGSSKVGRDGDFYTSVSVGKCFGMILAHRISHYLDEYGSSIESLELIELGANTGQLACDILDCLKKSFGKYYEKVHYTICEHLEEMHPVQKATLSEHGSKLQFHKSLADIKTPFKHGIILSNELIDAFPVKLLTKQQNLWLENSVSLAKSGGFIFSTTPIHCPKVTKFIAGLPPLEDGYTTEFRPGLNAFTSLCASAIEEGMVITIDYGHNHSSYYSPERTAGTLQTFYNHTKGDSPLNSPGKQDLTAHVDFTQLASAFSKAKLEPHYFDSQSRYLTQYASSWFQQIELSQETPPAKLIRQFQTLTHPAMMGRQFHVLECKKNGTKHPSVSSKLEL